jgi:hypothetical protein
VSPNQDAYEVKIGSPDNKIFTSFNVDTYETKATAESIISTQRATDNDNPNKKIATDCSQLPVMEGRSYKASFDMIGNAQVFPFQYFYLNSIPIFNGIYQVTEVKHSITPNDMKTTAEGIRMRFSKGELAGIRPVTLDSLANINVVEEITDASSLASRPFVSRPQPVFETTDEGGGGSTLDFNFDPNVTDYDLWLYLTWNQGAAGATEHYKISKGKKTNYGVVTKDAIKKNWPGGLKSSAGIGKANIDSLYSTNPKSLSLAFIDVWKQQYAKKTEQALPKLNSSGKNRSGVLYSEIKKAFQKYEQPDLGLSWDRIGNFGMIENGLSTDTDGSKTFQSMFQMNKNYASNPDFKGVLDYAKKGQGHNTGWIEYDIYKLTEKAVPLILNAFNKFVSNSGFPN